MFRFLNKPVWRDYLLWIMMLLYLAILIYLLSDRPELLLFYRNASKPDLSISAICIMGITYCYLLATGILCCFYQPHPTTEDDSKLPSCTVLVPTYNEGSHVEETIKSLLASDYPRDKFEIIVINDGSEDNTWEYIQRGAAADKELVSTINLPANCGKKHALYVGSKKASGEVIVTVDSDSLVDPHTIRALVSPLKNPRVGAVAGSVQVKNREESYIASLLDVLLVFSCEFLRAAQSVTGMVLCTPGALSAYRKKALLPVIDEWRNQVFLGKPATIGEDRALATLILRSNYLVVHQRTALVRTCVPNDVSNGTKMMLRWLRGDLRENLLMTKFTFKNFHRKNVRSWVLLAYWIALTQNIMLPFLFVPAFIFMLCGGAKDPLMFYAANAIMSLVWASIPAVIYSRHTCPRKAIWAYLYGSTCPFILAVFYIYCFLTLGDSRWMTRSIKKKKSASEVSTGA